MTISPSPADVRTAPGVASVSSDVPHIAVGTGPTVEPMLTLPRLVAINAKGLELLTQVLLVTLIPRLLGPADFGRLTVALAIVTLASVAISMGAPAAFARFVPARPPEQRGPLARAMTMKLLRIRAIQLSSFAGVCAVLVAAGPFSGADVLFVFVALVAEVGTLLGAQVALGLGRTWVWSFRVGVRNLALLLSIPLLFRLVGPAGLLPGIAIASIAGFAFAAWTLVRVMGNEDRGASVPDGLLRYGTLAGATVLVGQLTYRGPALAIGILGGSSVETGFAGLASSVALAAMLAVNELFSVSLPDLVQHWEREHDAANRALRRLGWWTSPLLALVALIAVPLLARVLPLAAGDGFAPSAPALVPVLAMLPLLPLPAMAWQSAALRLQPGVGLVINTTALATFLVASIALVPGSGAAGASAALLLAVAVASSVGAWKFRDAVPPRLLLLAVLSSAAVMWLAIGSGLLR